MTVYIDITKFELTGQFCACKRSCRLLMLHPKYFRTLELALVSPLLGSMVLHLELLNFLCFIKIL